MGAWWLIAGLVCGCGGHPDWPAEGQVDAAWVEEALAWRVRANVRNCPDVAEAVDALTLEWIAASADVVVRVDHADWPVLAGRSEWVKPLVQILALDALHDQPARPLRTTQRLRRQVRLTHPLYPEDRRDFRDALRATRRAQKKAAEAAS